MSIYARYFLSNLPEQTSIQNLVHTTKARWRIERDYLELKQEFGLDHYEGRGWRGFHHHATLCIAAYGFFVSERLRGEAHQKNFQNARNLSYPRITGRAVRPQRAQRHIRSSIPTQRWLLAAAIMLRWQRGSYRVRRV